MRQYKLQLTISEEANSILSQLHRFDKARFVELAIRLAYDNKKLKKNFVWNNDDENSIQENEEANQSKTPSKNKNLKSELKKDDTKDPKIDHRW